MKYYLVLSAGLLLSSCASGYQSQYYYNQIMIQNTSDQVLHQVSLDSGESGRSFSCSNITPKGICSDRFSRRLYLRTPVQVSWQSGDGAAQSREVLLETPAYFINGSSFPLRGVFQLGSQGSISAFFEQDVP